MKNRVLQLNYAFCEAIGYFTEEKNPSRALNPKVTPLSQAVPELLVTEG